MGTDPAFPETVDAILSRRGHPRREEPGRVPHKSGLGGMKSVQENLRIPSLPL